jgi:Ni,Fe-hydrogenase III small subunit
LEQRDDLQAGRTPRVPGDGLTDRDLCNRFLTQKKSLVDSRAQHVELRDITKYTPRQQQIMGGPIICGPVTENMRTALLETSAAVPAPKLVITVGACAISGGPLVNHPEVHNGRGSMVPPELYITGCPPHTMTVLDGLLRLLGRLEQKQMIQVSAGSTITGDGTITAN